MIKLDLNEEDVQDWVDSKSFDRGYRYFKDDVIMDAKRQGMTLKAYCRGSKPSPYRVRVIFDQVGISEAHCSCPVGRGGHCKHVAALLFTYLNYPSEFREVEEIDNLLEKRNKKELIELIKQMVNRRPGLEELIETALPTESEHHVPLDPGSYRRLAASAFKQTRYGWYDERAIADELNSVIDLGKAFADQDDYNNAAIIYREVSQEVLSQYEIFRDEEGELGGVVNNCVEGLGECLSRAKNDISVREMILHALFEIYRFDVDLGGVCLGDDVPDIILKYATPKERSTIANWVRAAMSPEKKDSYGGQWGRQVYGGFLLDLKKEALDNESYLRICRETGRIEDLVDRLLTMEQDDEAVAEAEKASDYELIHLADIFVAHGQGRKAEQLLLERSKNTKDSRVLDWLKSRYREQGDVSEALTFAQRIFQMQNSLSNYQEVRDLAQKAGHWKNLRNQMLTELANRKRYNLLTKIYLEEDEIDRALETLEFTRDPLRGYNLQVEVARAAKKTHPHAAIEIYSRLAENLIKSRGRKNYQEACTYLTQACKIYKSIDQEEKWTWYIENLRKQNHNLPALMDELSKAGL